MQAGLRHGCGPRGLHDGGRRLFRARDLRAGAVAPVLGEQRQRHGAAGAAGGAAGGAEGQHHPGRAGDEGAAQRDSSLLGGAGEALKR